MGLRFRKSVNLGLFRINFSKHGIGYSFGAKGMRYTKKSSGGSRITASLPGTGVSYSKDFSGSRKRKKTRTGDYSQNSAEPQQEPVFEASNRTELEKKFNSLKKKSTMLIVLKGLAMAATFVMWAVLMAIINTYIIEVNNYWFLVGMVVVFAALLIEFYLIPHVASVDLKYDISEEESKRAYQKMIAGLLTLMSNMCVREISGDVHVGKRINVNFFNDVKIEKKPLFVSANINIALLKLQHKQLLFLPDALMICENDTWKHIEYDKIIIQYADSSLVEKDCVPSDSEVLTYTWLHANKNGGQDKRYSDNYQVPVCAVGVVGIQTTNGIDITLVGSSRDKTRTCYEALNNYCKFFTENMKHENDINEIPEQESFKS